jgi:hypothetical protein
MSSTLSCRVLTRALGDLELLIEAAQVEVRRRDIAHQSGDDGLLPELRRKQGCARGLGGPRQSSPEIHFECDIESHAVERRFGVHSACAHSEARGAAPAAACAGIDLRKLSESACAKLRPRFLDSGRGNLDVAISGERGFKQPLQRFVVEYAPPREISKRGRIRGLWLAAKGFRHVELWALVVGSDRAAGEQQERDEP